MIDKALRVSLLTALLAVAAAGGASALNVSLAELDASGLLLTQRVGAYVSVTDDLGGPVEGLQKEAFTVSESSDGENFRPVSGITAFTPEAGASEGITFMLLIDNSGSMYDTVEGKPTQDQALMRVTHAKDAVRAFLSRMTDPSDRVGLVSFNTFFTKLSPPVSDRERISALLDGIGKPTPDQAYTELYASLALASREFAGVSGRKAIIVLSDGENYPYAVHSGREHPVFKSRIYGYDEPITACQQEGVTVYGISFGPEKDRNLQAISVETGGKLFDAADAAELTNAYAAIHRQVAGEYLIDYRATIAPAEKKYVRVSVSGPGGAASATRFYFAGTVFGLPIGRLTLLLLVPFLAAAALLWVLTVLKLETRRGPASLEVLQTRVGRPVTRVVPLTGTKTVIGGARSADLTVVGSPQMKEQHATILFDPKDKSYTIAGSGDIMVNNQPVKTKKLEPGDVIDAGGATIVFDPGEEKEKK